MNYIDIVILVLIALAMWNGFHRGFINGIVDLLILAGSLTAAFMLYPYLAAMLGKRFASLGVWTSPVSFILTLILSRIVLSLALARGMASMLDEDHKHETNKLLGLIPGFVNGLINATIAVALLLALPIMDGLSDKTRESRLAGHFTGPAEWLETKLAPVFDEAVKKTMHNLTVEPGSKESVNLSFTVNNPKIREDLEARMLDLVNEEREKQGLKPLKADPELTLVARAHSRDMFARGYFAHNTPDGKDPFDRMRAAGVRFLTAGENLALGQTLSITHNGLMNSPGHRKNILRPEFGRVGIGILDGGMYGLMVTQNFRN